MKPRDYQEEAVKAVFKEWESVNNTLGVAATGLGKTFIMTEVVVQKGCRAILLAHRSELIWQARKAFMLRGIDCEIEKGELVASTSLFNRSQVVLATVQTMTSGEVDRKRMQRFDPKDFGILLYDESHHAVSPGNKSIVDYFTKGNPDLKVLGVTATPDRSDEEALGQIFETVAFEYDILFGVENGWLIEPEQLMVHVGGLDFSEIKTTMGDLNSTELSKAMESESSIQGVALPTLEAMFGCEMNALNSIPKEGWAEFLLSKRKPKRTIVFTASVQQAEMLSNIFNRVILGISDWVCGKTDEESRRNIFSRFDSGESSILVNCGVTTEGYDNPAVEIIAVARPTKSRSLYAQMIGRGTRPLPKVVDGLDLPEERLEAIAKSAKPRALVLDFVGNSGKHKLICLADILGGKSSDAAINAVIEKAKKSKTPLDMRKELDEEEERIKKEAELRRAAEEARKAKLVAKVRYSSTKINPFDALDISPVKARGWDNGKQLSQKQSELLMKQGIDPSTMTYSQGRQLLNEMFRRWSGKFCTLKQASTLKKFYPNLDTRSLTMKDASAKLDALAKNKWRPLPHTVEE